MQKKDYIATLNDRFQGCAPETILQYFLEIFDTKIALSSSLSLEDQVLTDMAIKVKPDARIFTLDTGRLFPETYNLIERTNRKYGINIEVFFPESKAVQDMVAQEGINLFYYGIDQRKRCCKVRKLEPLSRAFKGLEAWICGLRREQSVTRSDIKLIEWDSDNNLIKLNPLVDWTEQQVKDYISRHEVTYNKLHDDGFPSIGCQPCTRAIEEGEDVRAGRWWWESPDHKECGLHRRH